MACTHLDGSASSEPEFTSGNLHRQQIAREKAVLDAEERLRWFALRLYLVPYHDAVPQDTQDILSLPVGEAAEMAQRLQLVR